MTSLHDSVCVGCTKQVLNPQKFRRDVLGSTSIDAASSDVLISWGVGDASPTCPFCIFASYATQEEPPYPGRDSQSSQDIPPVSSLEGKNLTLTNESVDLDAEDSGEGLLLLKTTSAKTLYWSVSTTKGHSLLSN